MPTRPPAKRLDKPARLSPHRCRPLTPLSEEPSQSLSHPRPDPARTGPDHVIPSPCPSRAPLTTAPSPPAPLPFRRPQIPRSVSACKLQNTSIAPARGGCIYIFNVNTGSRAGFSVRARGPVPAGREQEGRGPVATGPASGRGGREGRCRAGPPLDSPSGRGRRWSGWPGLFSARREVGWKGRSGDPGGCALSGRLPSAGPLGRWGSPSPPPATPG